MRRTTTAILCVLATIGPASAEPDANALLFETPYLSRVAPGTRLTYRIAHPAADPAAGPAFADIVELALAPGTGPDQRTATLTLRGAEREREVGPFADMTGNPVLLVFLEQDVLGMSRTLKGGATYLRKRVRLALEAAESEPVRVLFEGREIEARRISVTPFAQDPNGDKLREYAQKRYEIVLADAVPGGLYEIRTVAPGSGAPLAEDRLSFERAEPAR